MTIGQRFRTVDEWRMALGLLPIPLRESNPLNGGPYVLLNGTTGNFCLDFRGEVDRTSQRIAAWSSDVGHYVTCTDEAIVVNRWDKIGQESYSPRSVIEKLHEFHRHLETTSPDQSRSIVAHILRVFRQIRAATEEQATGIRSLRILLHLLASAAAGTYRLEDLDEGRSWGLRPELLESSQAVPEATWHSLRQDLSGLGRTDDLQPDFPLVLRHASGALFQHAHIEARLSSALWLPGLELPAIIHPRQRPEDTGIYGTPPFLARTLAEEAIRGEIAPNSGQPLRLFDPACGSGELLKECLRLLHLKGYDGRVEVVAWDKSPASVDMTRFVLEWEKRTWSPDQLDIAVAQRDSLADLSAWPTDIDIVLMNPPFKSWQAMTVIEQDAVANILGPSNKPNLALAFASLAQAAVRQGGTLAMVAPNSLFQASSAANVRETLSANLAPQLIARLGDQGIFARALVDAGLYVGKRNPARPVPTAVLWADARQRSLSRALCGLRKWRDTSGTEPLQDEGFSVYQGQDIGNSGAPWVARAYEAWATHAAVQRTRRTIAAKRVFDIKQGTRLGNDIFIVPKDYLSKLSRQERRFFRPAVMNVSISDGRLNDKYYVFYPYSDGLPAISSDDVLEEYVPTYFREFLKPAKAKLASRRSLGKVLNAHWWDLLWPRTWQAGRTRKLISKYFGDHRSFAFDQDGEFVVVVGHAWLVQKGAVQLEVTDEELYFAVLAYLNSSVARDLLKYVSIQVSGGQWDLSKKYLSNLPIPDFAKLGQPTVGEFVNAGMGIVRGKTDWPEIDQLVRSSLRLPQ